MNYRKRGLKALGLSLLAALSLMAFTASGAQANGLFLMLEADHSTVKPGHWSANITGTALKLLEHRLNILGLNMEIFCHTAHISGLINELGTGTFNVEYLSCLAQGVSGGALTGAVCTIPNIVATGKVLVILHSGNTNLTQAQHGTGTGNPYLLITPNDLLTFAKVLNHTECALPENANVKGCAVLGIANNDHRVTHIVTNLTFAASLFGCKLTYGANEAHINAEAEVKLANSATHGDFAGRLWGAV